MASSEFQHFSPAWTLLVPAGYMVVTGIAGLVWPLFHLGPSHAEFREQSLAFRAGARTRELILSAASIVAGIALFWHHSWARTLALGLLLIETFYYSNAFAWGFSGGQPTRRVILFSRVVVAGWNGLWFYMIFRLAP
jgi:hypothetical protein